MSSVLSDNYTSFTAKFRSVSIKIFRAFSLSATNATAAGKSKISSDNRQLTTCETKPSFNNLCSSIFGKGKIWHEIIYCAVSAKYFGKIKSIYRSNVASTSEEIAYDF